jgi:hypothetical protein
MDKRAPRGLRRDEEAEGVTVEDLSSVKDLLADSAKAGWLSKLGEQSMIKQWKSRFVVLSGPLLFYFVAGDSKAPQGVIHLHGATVKPSPRGNAKERAVRLSTVVESTVAASSEGGRQHRVWSELPDAKRDDSPVAPTAPDDAAEEVSCAPIAFEIATRSNRKFHFRSDGTNDSLAWVRELRRVAGVGIDFGESLRLAPRAPLAQTGEHWWSQAASIDPEGLQALEVVEQDELQRALEQSAAMAAPTRPDAPPPDGTDVAEVEPEDEGTLVGVSSPSSVQMPTTTPPVPHPPPTPAAPVLSFEARQALLGSPEELQAAWAMMATALETAHRRALLQSTMVGVESLDDSEDETEPVAVPSSALSFAPPSHTDHGALEALNERLRREVVEGRKAAWRSKASLAALTARIETLEEALDAEAQARFAAELSAGPGGVDKVPDLTERVAQLEKQVEAEKHGRMVAQAKLREWEASVDGIIADRLETSLADAVRRARDDAEEETELRMAAEMRAQLEALRVAERSGRRVVEERAVRSTAALALQSLRERDRLWRSCCRKGLVRLRERLGMSPSPPVDDGSGSIVSDGPGRRPSDAVSLSSDVSLPKAAPLTGTFLEALQWTVSLLPPPEVAIVSSGAKGVAAASAQVAAVVAVGASKSDSVITDAKQSDDPEEDMNAIEDDGALEEDSPPALPPRDDD